MCPLAHLPYDPKPASFEWGPEIEKALQQIQASVQASLPRGPCDPADPMVLEMSWHTEGLFAAVGRPIGKLQHEIWSFWRKSLKSSMDNYFPFEK